ncbi:hypothetical protein [Aquabacterium sp. NJ1]|uniref:hypothetical protein n=1 Tax=Aquabacterium sp. NJ1 TaxID=1538295 RepID=UPI001376BC47|nr:hypothetical protein [Aquabacterium sp. NJ1]
MQLNPQVVLALVGGLLFVLGMRDVIKHKRITPAAKGRLMVALIFAAVLAWQAWQHQP